MDKEKIVVVLLLVTIILSISSIVVTFSLNSFQIPSLQTSQGGSVNSGNVNLVIEEPPEQEVNQ